jgi:hypothetical protein
MDIWKSIKQSNFDRLFPIQSAGSYFMDKTIGNEKAVKWSPDLGIYFNKQFLYNFHSGETVHKDMSPPNHILLKHFLAGGIAGFVSRTTTAPIDRLKVFIQVCI